MKKIAILTAALSLLVCGTSMANSRFTVINGTNETLKVEVFNGDDGACTISLKTKKVDAGTRAAIGCAGGGKHRCKIRLLMSHGDHACDVLEDSCGLSAIKIPNDSQIRVNLNHGKTDCIMTGP